jgi:predicted RNase H-like nuclease (RuvC/YqgF family)
MNTTDYFTNINAMFLFCIFTCGLLSWAVIRGYILKGKLLKEQDSHLKATLINTKLNKALDDEKKVSDNMEKLLRQVETEVRDLQAKLDHAEADRIELRAERATLENKLTDALAKVRKRDKDGKFLPSGNARPKRVKKVKVESYAKRAFDEIMGNPIDQLDGMTVKPKLIHGLTVKNPTEEETKMIFDEAKRLGIEVEDPLRVTSSFPWIWVSPFGLICSCGAHHRYFITYATAKEFVQRMQNGRG